MNSGEAPANAGRKFGLGFDQVNRTVVASTTSNLGGLLSISMILGGPDGAKSSLLATSSQ